MSWMRRLPRPTRTSGRGGSSLSRPPAASSMTPWQRNSLEEEHIALLCGRYEGFDERVHDHLATDVVSIGPYVLAGGELAAMVVADATTRKLPGALGHEDSAIEESFSPALDGAPEYPHYTRPAEYRGWGVPEILLSGDHAKVREWRLAKSRDRYHSRPARPRFPLTTSPRPDSLAHEHDHRKHRAATAAPSSPVRPG